MAFILARYLIGDFVSGLLRGKSRKWDVVRSCSGIPICRGIKHLPERLAGIPVAGGFMTMLQSKHCDALL